jgi:hypothetical protein
MEEKLVSWLVCLLRTLLTYLIMQAAHARHVSVLIYLFIYVRCLDNDEGWR